MPFGNAAANLSGTAEIMTGSDNQPRESSSPFRAIGKSMKI